MTAQRSRAQSFSSLCVYRNTAPRELENQTGKAVPKLTATHSAIENGLLSNTTLLYKNKRISRRSVGRALLSR